jgi:hypothetical protein
MLLDKFVTKDMKAWWIKLNSKYARRKKVYLKWYIGF